MDNKGYEHHISKNSDISITSSLFIYKVLKATEQNFETPGTFEENDRTFVVLDEIYRPGHDVEIKKQFYGVWREDMDVGAAEMISFIESKFDLKLSLNDSIKRSQDFKDNLLVTNNEKWERRKDLTGVILKTTTNAVIQIQLHI